RGIRLREQLQPEIAPALVAWLDAVEFRDLRRLGLDEASVGRVRPQVEATLLRASVAEIVRAIMREQDTVLERLPRARVRREARLRAGRHGRRRRGPDGDGRRRDWYAAEQVLRPWDGPELWRAPRDPPSHTVELLRAERRGVVRHRATDDLR